MRRGHIHHARDGGHNGAVPPTVAEFAPCPGRVPSEPSEQPSGVLARPDAELRRESNGRESWVFRAANPNELLGVHAEQVGRALQPGEALRFLLYSPMWEGHGGPFGIGAPPASHAVAVTERRFVISRDTHIDGEPPALFSIPFSTVLWIESGGAAMFAWLVIRYVDEGAVRSVTVLYRALGQHHFAAAVRAYRWAAFPEFCHARTGAPPWPAVWRRIGERQREDVEPLLVEAEQPLAVAAWPALAGWNRKHGLNNPGCIAPAGALLVSTRGVLAVGDEPPTRIGGVKFGVNAVAVPFDTVRTATFDDRTTSGPWVVALRLEAGRGVATSNIEVLFPGESLPEIEAALGACREHPAVREIAWSS